MWKSLPIFLHQQQQHTQWAPTRRSWPGVHERELARGRGTYDTKRKHNKGHGRKAPAAIESNSSSKFVCTAAAAAAASLCVHHRSLSHAQRSSSNQLTQLLNLAYCSRAVATTHTYARLFLTHTHTDRHNLIDEVFTDDEIFSRDYFLLRVFTFQTIIIKWWLYMSY